MSAPPSGHVAAALRLSEVISALSRALDLTEGQLPGHSVRSCLIGMRLGVAVGLGDDELSDLYYALLLKDAGCSSNAARVAALFGADDHPVKRALKTVDWPRFHHAAGYALRQAGRGRAWWRRLVHLARVGAAGQRGARQLVQIRCERGAAIARSLGFSDRTAGAIRALDEHWDGHGHPDGRRAAEIPLLARIAGLAQTAEVLFSERGREGMLGVVRRWSGRWFDPTLVAAFEGIAADRAWWDVLEDDAAEGLVSEAEPTGEVQLIDEVRLDAVAAAFADVVDTKSPYTSRHSREVARYARGIAQRSACDEGTCRRLHRAGLLHDLGKLAVSNRILDKRGPLTAAERSAVQRHPLYTWDILSRVSAFDDLAWTASIHHERLDGGGYPWGLRADALDFPARILAAADVYEALTADRPYRRGLSPAQALSIIEEEVGRHLDADVVAALASWIREGGDEGSAPPSPAAGPVCAVPTFPPV